jgi:hypothetical protein
MKLGIQAKMLYGREAVGMRKDGLNVERAVYMLGNG